MFPQSKGLGEGSDGYILHASVLITTTSANHILTYYGNLFYFSIAPQPVSLVPNAVYCLFTFLGTPKNDNINEEDTIQNGRHPNKGVIVGLADKYTQE